MVLSAVQEDLERARDGRSYCFLDQFAVNVVHLDVPRTIVLYSAVAKVEHDGH